MPADILSTFSVALSWGATYLVHSTLLLGGVWIFLKLKPAAGHSFSEALWKMALVGGVNLPACRNQCRTNLRELTAKSGIFQGRPLSER